MNTTFDIGIAGGAVLGARELAGGPPTLAHTGASLLAVALVLLLRGPQAVRRGEQGRRGSDAGNGSGRRTGSVGPP